MIALRDHKANGHEPGRLRAGSRAEADWVGGLGSPSETPVCLLREAWASFLVKGREIRPAHGESAGCTGERHSGLVVAAASPVVIRRRA